MPGMGPRSAVRKAKALPGPGVISDLPFISQKYLPSAEFQQELRKGEAALLWRAATSSSPQSHPNRHSPKPHSWGPGGRSFHNTRWPRSERPLPGTKVTGREAQTGSSVWHTAHGWEGSALTGATTLQAGSRNARAQDFSLSLVRSPEHWLEHFHSPRRNRNQES